MNSEAEPVKPESELKEDIIDNTEMKETEARTSVEADQISSLAPFPFAKFRQRILASVIDTVVLGIGLSLLSIPLRGFFFRIGPYGRIVSLILMVTYFTIYNSNLKNGQTIGKRFMKIGVANARKELISVKTSFYRALLFSLLIIMNQWALPLWSTPVGSIFANLFVWGFCKLICLGIWTNVHLYAPF
ncbi:MAG: RDD family protein [Chloroflexota bacterium]